MATPERTVAERVEQKPESLSSEEAVPARTFEVKNMSIWYGEKRAIDNVSLDVASNAVTAIIGPSGCGKSTFLRALNRMVSTLNSTDIQRHYRTTAICRFARILVCWMSQIQASTSKSKRPMSVSGRK